MNRWISSNKMQIMTCRITRRILNEIFRYYIHLRPFDEFKISIDEPIIKIKYDICTINYIFIDLMEWMRDYKHMIIRDYVSKKNVYWNFEIRLDEEEWLLFKIKFNNKFPNYEYK